MSCVYGWLVRLRVGLYRTNIFRSVRFPVPVIVVGNVVTGGGGKTPLVIALAQHLQRQGRQVGIVSRGYGRRSPASWLEITPTTTAREGGDEPVFIQRQTAAPVFVGHSRVEAVQHLLAAYPATNVVLTDDGLQHYALARDIEITVFDDRGVGNGWLLPAGPLRENWPRSTSVSPNLTLHTGRQPAFAGFRSTRRLAGYAIDASGKKVPLAEFSAQPVTALAAIAQPEAFFDMLMEQQINPVRRIALPDHCDFSQLDWTQFAKTTVLCTEKDAVKLWAYPAHTSVNILAVPLDFLPEPGFFAAFDALLADADSQLPFAHGHQTS